ncbi:MAG: beta-lactamase family protein [Defluviitaleaceae bacterium]|nr:beta-lactamase family protein [Defluviitaleaceae bacterium]
MKILKSITALALAVTLTAPSLAYATEIDNVSIFKDEAYWAVNQFKEILEIQNLEFSVIDLNTDFSYYSSDLLFGIASITKPFTAVAIMQLVERGLIDLDSPIINYIPDFRHKENPVTGGNYRDVTVRMLLNHTSGIQNDFLSEWFTSDGPSSNYMNDLVSNLADHYFIVAPGYTYIYNNNGINLLGVVIANVTGYEDDPFTGYINYIQENILNPLGMINTTFPTVGLENFADFYLSAGEQVPEELTIFANILPAGGLISSPKDMINFMRFLLEGNEDILGNAYREKMLYAPFMEFESGMNTDLMNPNVSMGFAHWILPNGNMTIGHTGGLIFHYSNMLLDFETGVGTFSITNSLSGMQAGVALAINLLNLKNVVMGYEMDLLPITQSEPIERLVEELEVFTGLYRTPISFLEVVLKEGALHLEISPKTLLELIPLEDGTFSLQMIGERVRFIEIEGVKVMMIGYFGDETLTRIEPIEAHEQELSILGRFYPAEVSTINYIEIRQHSEGFIYATVSTIHGINTIMLINHFQGNRFLGDGAVVIDFEWHGETWWRTHEYITFNFMGMEFRGGN